ncbi:hypothetical protein QQF64_034781 [Cirrhinus molitorella]|uniref:SH2 domain-containing protein n=1 Tax=Cirrhinus molitorella TaxID=172907 RepID=A0ABR3L1P7_9TELE
MARWFKEHLGFKTTKAPPPAPPKPDYRHFHTTVSSPPAFHLQQQSGTGLMSAQPDILTAYKLQKELDFEDPYTPGGNMPFSTGLSSAGSPDVKYVSPKHRLIKVETVERSGSSSGSSSGVTAVKSPTSPPAEPENGKQEKVRPMRSHAYLHSQSDHKTCSSFRTLPLRFIPDTPFPARCGPCAHRTLSVSAACCRLLNDRLLSLSFSFLLS